MLLGILRNICEITSFSNYIFSLIVSLVGIYANCKKHTFIHENTEGMGSLNRRDFPNIPMQVIFYE